MDYDFGVVNITQITAITDSCLMQWIQTNVYESNWSEVPSDNLFHRCLTSFFEFLQVINIKPHDSFLMTYVRHYLSQKIAATSKLFPYKNLQQMLPDKRAEGLLNDFLFRKLTDPIYFFILLTQLPFPHGCCYGNKTCKSRLSFQRNQSGCSLRLFTINREMRISCFCQRSYALLTTSN